MIVALGLIALALVCLLGGTALVAYALALPWDEDS